MAEYGAEGEVKLLRAVEEAIKQIALVVNNSVMYGFSHSVTQQSITPAFEKMSQALDMARELTLAVTEEGLVANGRPLDPGTPAVSALLRRMRGLDLSNFTLQSGLTIKEFGDLLEIMSARAEQIEALGGIARLIELAKFGHIRVQKVTYRAVTDEQAVVSAEEAVQDAAGAGDRISVEDHEIGEYLKGDEAKPSGHVAGGVLEMAARVPTLGDLILDAAGIDAVPEDVEAGRALAQRIVRCLRRVYEALKQDSSFATQRGKKETAKTLESLRDHVCGKLSGKYPQFAAEGLDLVNEAVEELTDEVGIESLAAEYARKRRAIIQNENRILRYMKSKGLDVVEELGLKQRLQEFGLPQEEWSALVARVEGRAKPAEGVESYVPGRIGSMLAALEEDGQETMLSQGVEKLVSMLDEIEREVNSFSDDMDGRIGDLVDQVQTDSGRLAGGLETEPRLPRDKMIETMAEIVQELCQPLSVISCSIGMVLSKNLGEIGKTQMEALKLASTSSERLNNMIERLSEISGLPASLAPDKNIQEALAGGPPGEA